MSEYTVIILLTLAGFLAVAALLLVPIYFFLQREEKASERWTGEALQERMREPERRSNGASSKNAE